jgi:hypothetical protein
MPSSIYFVLGCSESGKRTILLDLLQNAFPQIPKTAIYLTENEALGEGLSAFKDSNSEIQTFEWCVKEGEIFAAPPPPEVTCTFFIFQGKRSPVEALELFSEWLSDHHLSLTRILTILDASQAAQKESIKEWYDTCLHFSDAVIFTHEDQAPKGWSEAYATAFRKAHYPCLFLSARKGHVDNPSLALDHTIRRISQAFDEEIFIDDEGEGEAPYQDPYFERLETGEYAKPLQNLE